MAALIGRIEEYDSEKEEWPFYVERLEHYLQANGIREEKKKCSVFLAVIGASAYKLVRSLVAPEKPGEKTFKELTEIMATHYNPVPSEIVQRYKFHTRVRQPSETVSAFVSELRSLAEHCNFGDTLEPMLRDRLVCGINDDAIQKRLLAHSDLSFTKALRTAQGMEAAANNLKKLHDGDRANEEREVNKMSHRGEQKDRKKEEKGSGGDGPCCYRCGKAGHLATQCRHRGAKCHNCGKVGHLRVVCRSQPQPRNDTGKPNSRAVNHLEEYTLLKVEENINPLKVVMLVDGQKLEMEVDTGASLSLISKSTYQRLKFARGLQPSTVNLRTYSGEPVKVLGTVEVDAAYGEQKHTLPLLVVEGRGTDLLGRNWMAMFKLDWEAIHQVNDNGINAMLAKHSKLFEGGLGTLKGYKAKLHIDQQAVPKFCKARPVPYAMREKVEEELHRLVHEGILKPVQYADWAAPIVPVLKKDGESVRICGDFKQTVNKVTSLDHYPIPKIEDLLTKLTGEKKFTVLDLSQAYQQLQLDETSQQYVVINPHKMDRSFPYGKCNILQHHTATENFVCTFRYT